MVCARSSRSGRHHAPPCCWSGSLRSARSATGRAGRRSGSTRTSSWTCRRGTTRAGTSASPSTATSGTRRRRASRTSRSCPRCRCSCASAGGCSEAIPSGRGSCSSWRLACGRLSTSTGSRARRSVTVSVPSGRWRSPRRIRLRSSSARCTPKRSSCCAPPARSTTSLGGSICASRPSRCSAGLRAPTGSCSPCRSRSSRSGRRWPRPGVHRPVPALAVSPPPSAPPCRPSPPPRPRLPASWSSRRSSTRSPAGRSPGWKRTRHGAAPSARGCRRGRSRNWGAEACTATLARSPSTP